MKRFAILILALLLLVTGSVYAQVPLSPYQGFTNPYNVGGAANSGPFNRPILSPSLGILNQNGPAGAALRYNVNTVPQQRYNANQLYQNAYLQSVTGLGAAPPGAIGEDLYAITLDAGHPTGFNNTLGFYPGNRATTTATPRVQPPAPKKQ